MEAHSFAASDFNPDAHGVAAVPGITSFVAERNGVREDEANAWAAEQQDVGERGEFYLACLQFCFTATRPC
jgi:hypothetical protein